MRRAAVLLCLLASATAGPRPKLRFLPDAEQAVEIARTRGKLIFLTVAIDNDAENRMAVDGLFSDRAFIKIAPEFVLLYANIHDKHGKVMVRNKQGKREPRCRDCPTIRCEDHMNLAQNYARAFYPTNDCRTPCHFVIDANEDVVEIIYEGDLNSGLNPVPPKTVVAKLDKLLRKRGRGLTEPQYEAMLQALASAKAARARANFKLELEWLAKVVALERDVEGVRSARKRLEEIDLHAAGELEKVAAKIDGQLWEEALDALEKLERTYPGTASAKSAGERRKALLDRTEVKRLLKALDIYQRGVKYKERKKLELARKKFEECVRRFPGTKYAELSQKELDAMGGPG